MQTLAFQLPNLSTTAPLRRKHSLPASNSFEHASTSHSIQAVASRRLDSAACADVLVLCVEASICDDEELDGEDVALGLSGEVSVDARAAEDVVLRGICLRKTRAGGNWLQGGILEIVLWQGGCV